MIFMIFSLLVCLARPIVSVIDWNGKSWAQYCEWPDVATINSLPAELSSAEVSSEMCASLCSRTPNCTHWQWTIRAGRTNCTMKQYAVFKSEALESTDPYSLCGLIFEGVEFDIQTNIATSCDWHSKFLTKFPSSKNQCFPQCQKTSSCTHFAWSSGTCWLFTGLVDLTLMTHTQDSDSICGYIPTGVIWYGDWARSCNWYGDELKVVYTTLDKCAYICSKTKLCTHYTWRNGVSMIIRSLTLSSNFNENVNGTCFLKKNFVNKEKAYFTSDSGMICGLVNSGIDFQDNLQASHCDWTTPALMKVSAFNSDQCAYKCITTPDCSHFTYSLGSCSLRKGPVVKSQVRNTYNTKDNNMVCGYVSSGISWTHNNWAFGCDWNDNLDFQTKSGLVWHQCDQLCMNTPYCTHYSWSTLSGGTCYLKKNPIKREHAIGVEDPFRVCGVVHQGLDWRNQYFASCCEWTTSSFSNTTTLGNKCLSKCQATPSCTHFTWTENVCYLGTGVVDKSLTRRSKYSDSICGYNPDGQNIIWKERWARKCDWPQISSSEKNLSAVYFDTLDECVENCTHTLNCSHYTYNSANKLCFLKTGPVFKSQAIPLEDPNVTCGLVADGVDWQNQNYANNCDWFDKPSRNLTVVLARNHEHCVSICLLTQNCTHYTFQSTTGPSGSCWLKRGPVDKTRVVHTKSAEMICGYVRAGIKWQDNQAKACGWYGSDMANITVPANQCASQCISTPDCTHYSYTPRGSGEGVCWLKSGLVVRADAFYNGDPLTFCGFI